MTIFCRASDLIRRLQQMIDTHGDCDVCLRDPGTRYRMPIGLLYREAHATERWPARFEITASYNDLQSGIIGRSHDLYKDGDECIPRDILDRNGQVVLGLCRECGQAEGDLDPFCKGPRHAK
jgi:hypothetical protein